MALAPNYLNGIDGDQLFAMLNQIAADEERSPTTRINSVTTMAPLLDRADVPVGNASAMASSAPTIFGAAPPPSMPTALANPPAAPAAPRQYQNTLGDMSSRKLRFEDVLGVIGDAMRATAKLDPLYLPTMERRRLNQAVAGYARDPSNPAARENFLAIDPLKLMELESKRAKDRQDAQASRMDMLKTGTQISRDQLQMRGDFLSQGLPLLADATDQATWTAARDQIFQLASQYGVELSDADIPAGFDPRTARTILMRGLTAKERLDAELNREKFAWGREDDRSDNARQERDSQSLESYRRGQLGLGRERIEADREADADRVLATVVNERGEVTALRPDNRVTTLRNSRPVSAKGSGRTGGGGRSDLIGAVYTRGNQRIQYSKKAGGYVDLATGKKVD